MSTYLMKSEPSEYSITDLERDGNVIWYGVRNYLARNTMRDLMRAGDTVLFYHSSCKVPGIYGIARVIEPIRDYQSVLELENLLMWRDFRIMQSLKSASLKSDLSVAFPDFTQFDSESKYFDPKSTRAKPIWYCVMVKFERVLTAPITLADLRDTPDLATLRILSPGNRLSITPVSDAEFEVISEKFSI